ncbi:hypothetical protein AK812_SmicGene25230 [Symbiodinium microadriaticum]|uniref:RRM domain-containing protein n=1 Tax=Symbiodinium microadriaticum TaxID=2951 RepID=A0A1Q9DCX8_SYMMI|nr:hypothetical protein AK812_SmicGene25230 [Symbiodinium microadriaticum]
MASVGKTPSEERRASTEHPVVSEPKEWAGADESDDDKPIEKHASRSFEARERRLTVAAVNLQSDKILGDQEVTVVDQQKEWKDGEESDEEASPDRVAKRASQSFQKRESRLAQGAVIRRSFCESEASHVVSFEQSGSVRQAAPAGDSRFGHKASGSVPPATFAVVRTTAQIDSAKHREFVTIFQVADVEMTLTNSVIAPLPAGMALDAAKVAFENFGEVSRVQRLEKFDSFVQVVFYDVRSADRAVKAFGAAGCISGPQVGDRTVMLAGDDQLSTKDFQNISEVCKSQVGEWQVVIHNLPVKILTKVMMEAVFQQAGFDGYLKEFTIQAGKAGEVVAKFADQLAAQRCVAHFCGCQWDNKSGAVVTAELVPPRETKPSKHLKKKALASASNEMSAEAPAFQPKSVAPYEFSAEAPIFMPLLGYMPKVEEEQAVSGNTRTRNTTKLAFGDKFRHQHRSGRFRGRRQGKPCSGETHPAATGHGCSISIRLSLLCLRPEAYTIRVARGDAERKQRRLGIRTAMQCRVSSTGHRAAQTRVNTELAVRNPKIEDTISVIGSTGKSVGIADYSAHMLLRLIGFPEEEEEEEQHDEYEDCKQAKWDANVGLRCETERLRSDRSESNAVRWRPMQAKTRRLLVALLLSTQACAEKREPGIFKRLEAAGEDALEEAAFDTGRMKGFGGYRFQVEDFELQRGCELL